MFRVSLMSLYTVFTRSQRETTSKDFSFWETFSPQCCNIYVTVVDTRRNSACPFLLSLLSASVVTVKTNGHKKGFLSWGASFSWLKLTKSSFFIRKSGDFLGNFAVFVKLNMFFFSKFSINGEISWNIVFKRLLNADRLVQRCCNKMTLLTTKQTTSCFVFNVEFTRKQQCTRFTSFSSCNSSYNCTIYCRRPSLASCAPP